ncbi:MAG: PKHD-type hydroxylase [Sphingomonadales bacterium]|jgi:PKHD-type hydroxylase|nr:PKHD-type hydroxylase [Sphingomonadales bacterium]
MYKLIPDLLTKTQVETLRKIAKSATFVDGRVSNPHSTRKNNLQLHETSAYQQSSQLILQAMGGHEDFNNFVMPVAVAPPMLTRYTGGMHYGSHFDSAFIRFGAGLLRSDVSCTVFLSDPATYKGGALCVHLGSGQMRFRGPPGSAVAYPSDSLHEVEPVTEGERLVAITFIQSRIANPLHRDLVYEVGEVAAIEGNGMHVDNLIRLQRVQQNLLREWADKP